MTTDTTVHRRRVLAGVAALTGMTGCGGSGDAGPQFEDVNLRNFGPRRLEGSVLVGDPDGELVLNEVFELPGETTETDGFVRYGGVLTTEGTYEVSVKLRTAVGGETAASADVEVSDTDTARLVVAFSAPEIDAPIAIDTVENLDGIGGE